MKKALIIFQKNRAIGKVKTRLAATIGDENAMRVYNALVDKTHENAVAVVADKFLYFSDTLENEDRWNDYQLRIQHLGDLGERMFSALRETLAGGYDKVVIIGTDCFELTAQHIENAFVALSGSDYVIGPAFDGGYYLIGGNRADDALFLNKEWSTATVCDEAIATINSIGKSVFLIDFLNDVDVEADLGTLIEFVEK